MRSRLPVIRTVLLCGLLLAAPLAAPRALLAQPLADRLPADTVAYVGWAGADSLGSQYQGSHLKAVLEASSVPQFFDDFLPKLIDKIRQEDPQVRDALAGAPSLGRLWHAPCAFAFGGFDIANNQGNNAGNPGQPVPRILFVCRPGEDAAALKRQIDAIVQQVRRAAGPGAPDAYSIKSFRSGDLVGWSIGYDQPEAALAGGAGPGGAGRSLAGSAAFKSAITHAGKEPVVVAYVDAEALVKQVNQAVEKSGDVQASEMWPRVRDAAGLGGLKRLIFTQGFDGKDWGTQMFIDAPVPRKGLLAMLEAGPLSDDILKAVPATATLAGVSRFDPAKLVDEIRDAIQQVDENAAAKFDQGMDQASAFMGFDVRKDFLGALGDEWAYYTDPLTGGRGAMGFVMVNRLRDPKKADDALTKIQDFATSLIARQAAESKMKVILRETKVGDVTVHFVASPVFTPSWAIAGGNLYVGMYPQVVATAASRAARGGGKSLLDNPDFVALRQRLLGAAGGNAKASAFQFLDLPKTAPSSYQPWLMLSSFARMGDMAGVESPAMLFPPMDVLMQHLAPAASVSWTDDAGWHLRGVSPFPGSTVFAAESAGMMDMQSTAMMASIMLPSLNRAREQANRVKSASNLRQMGQGIQMFANENKGKFPKEIGQIPAAQDLTADVFVNPRKGSSMPPQDAMAGEAAAKWVRQNSDYVYVGAGKDYRMGADEVLAYEKPEGLSDGINVLFGDGHVEFLPTAQATPTIREGRKVGVPLAPFGVPRQRPPAPRNQGDRFAPRGAGGGL